MKRNKLALFLFAVALLTSLGAEHFVPHKVLPNAEPGIENRHYFYAGFGFASCIIMIFVSRVIGMFLRRRDDYYKEAKK
ncbi:MAG: hypothetical protein K0R98_352 [Rickettsiaceae bacterium]|jgi:hypothetical protein|nr:hypothetical protein [Rickettsiaceae bacterium]